MVCTAEGAWAYDDWDHNAHHVDELEDTPNATPAADLSSASGDPTSGDVHSKLAARQPTFPSPHEEAEPTPAGVETRNVEGSVEGSAEGGGGGGSGEGGEDTAAVDGEPEAPPGDENPDAWRCDKHGVQLQPQALYMRFYRKVRSTSPETKKLQLGFFSSN